MGRATSASCPSPAALSCGRGPATAQPVGVCACWPPILPAVVCRWQSTRNRSLACWNDRRPQDRPCPPGGVALGRPARRPRRGRRQDVAAHPRRPRCRNTLLWYRDLPSGTLDLTTAHPGGVSMLLAGRRTRLSDLVREPAAFEEARRRVRSIRSKAVELREERGIAAGFIAIGMATWSVPRAARPRPRRSCCARACCARPARRRRTSRSTSVPRPSSNRCSASTSGPSRASRSTRRPRRPRQRGQRLRPLPGVCRPGSRVRAGARVRDHASLVLGTFSYAKLPMVADLALQGNTLADHDVVAALAVTSRRSPRCGSGCRTASPTRTPSTSTSFWMPTPRSTLRSTPCAPGPTSSSRALPAPASRRPSSTSSPRSRPRASPRSSSPRSGPPSTPS